jgi:pyruvate,water dikinase
MSAPLPLAEVRDEAEHGGKAASLGAALRAGLPVPGGFALSHALVDAIAQGVDHAIAALRGLLERTGAPVAVRSSAVGEDGAGASFAGQHATVLGVATADALVAAVRRVRASAHDEAALAYRRRLGIAGPPRMGVVVQQIVDADAAGVMFTRCPVSGADERVVEGAWGLGESVVAGLVTPDRWRVARDGRVLERAAGEKDVAIRLAPGGGTREVQVDPERAVALCLDDARIAALHELALRCERHEPGPHDIEWAFVGPRLYLLQRRAVTRTARV